MPSLDSNKSVCVSLPKRLLDDIDRRAESMNLTRSMYLTLLAQQDLQILGPLIVRSADAQEPRTIELEDEAHRFLMAAIPELADYERRVRLKQPLDYATAPAPAETLADLWDQFLRERHSILENKWYRSGEAGRDIGIEAAIRDWLQNHAPKD
jgi:hypothetical protein